MQFEWGDGSEESDFNSLLGKHVRVHGLQARPEYNDQFGRVYSFDHNKGRAGVHLDSGPGLWVKPSNLTEVTREPEANPKDVATQAGPTDAADTGARVCTPQGLG